MWLWWRENERAIRRAQREATLRAQQEKKDLASAVEERRAFHLRRKLESIAEKRRNF